MRCPGSNSNGYHPNSTGYATAVAGGANCGTPVVTYADVFDTMAGCSGGSKIYRTWTAMDPDNMSLISTCTQIINLNDPASPTVTSCTDNISVPATSSNGAIVNYAVPSFGDNCGLASIIGSHSSGDLFPVGTTPVTYTAEDLCGNTVSCSFNISVSTPSCDVAPVISCPSDKVLCLNDSYTPSVTGYATASTSGAHCADPVVTYSDVVINSGPCTGQKIIKRTWTATDPDNSFLSSSCEQIIELKDSGVPVITSCPQDIAVDGGPWCDAAVTWEAPTATDDCGIVDVTSNYTSGTVFGGGSTQVVYTFTDACGNSTSCSFNIIVSCGNIGCSVTPIINCPSDVNNICVGNSVSPSVTGYATASPGLPACDDPVVSYTDVVMSQGNCAGAQVLKRIWRAEDPNDSSIFATCEQIISTVDNQPPTFVYCPDDVTVDGGAWCDAIVTWGPVSATDNCGLPDLDSNYSSGHVFNEGVTEVTYTATDACGNTSTCWFSVTVTCSNPCNTPPNINCPASVTLCPGSNYDPSVTGTATATPSGSCGNTIDIIYTDYIVSTGPCASEKVIHRTWTAKDQMDPSLQSSCVQTISLVDNVPPGIWECPSDITVEYGQPAIWFEPSADDNCGVPSFVSTHNNGSIFSQGTTEVTYTATDNCGNVALCSFTVTVPGPSANFECPDDIVVQCNANGGAPVTWDPPVYSGTCGNCDGGYIDGFIYMGSYNGHQYYCSTSPANWPTANAVCNANGGYLASVNNAGENAFLANILTTQSAWIGLNDAAQEGVFNWTNGDPFNYNNWYPGQPNDYNADQDYVEMLADGTWNDQYNIKQLEYIMEVPCQSVIQIAGPEPGSYLAAGNYEVVYKLHDSCGNATCSFDITVESSISMLCPDDVTLSCPVNETGLYVNWQSPVATSCCQDCSLGGVIDGFVYMGSFNGHYYYCSTAPATWPNANSSAQANGGYLAAINSPEENNFLANLLTIQSAYIGLNDAGSEGNFSWSNGDPLGFHNWYPGQPNDFNGFQDYVELLNNGEWNDQYNDKPLEYIMEIPGCIDVHQIAGPASGTFFHSNTTTTVTYQATDNCGNLTTCSFDVTVVKNECNSGGLDSGVCWIEGVKVGDIYNVTGNDGGYADYTDICTTIQPGVSYPLALGPWCQSTQYKVFWKIWIDFNMDGDYNDNGEFIAYGSAAGEISGSFTVPTTGVWSGTTTMRVAMKVGEFPTGPCEEFQYGETEDYCVEIVGADLKGEDETSSRSKDDTEYEVAILTGKELINYGVEVFPNPATDYLNIMLESSDQILDASIFAADGKMIKQLDVLEADSQISLDGMRTGIYFLNVRYNDGTLESARFIIQE